MVSQNTIDTINYVKDIDIEFNTKLIVMFLLLAYSCFFLWLSFRLENKKAWVVVTKYIGMRGMTIPYIFFMPFNLLLMYRGASLEAIFKIMLMYYSVIFVGIVLVFTLFGSEWILSFFGINNLGEILTTKIGSKRLNLKK